MEHNFKLGSDNLYINKIGKFEWKDKLESAKTIFCNLNKEKGRLGFLLQAKLNNIFSEQEFFDLYKEFYSFDVSKLSELYAKKIYGAYKEMTICSDEVIRVISDSKGHYFFSNEQKEFYGKEKYEKEKGEYRSVFFRTDFDVIIPQSSLLKKTKFTLEEIEKMSKNGEIIILSKKHEKQLSYSEYANNYEKNKNITLTSMNEVFQKGEADDISRQFKGVLNVLKDDLNTTQMFKDYKTYSQRCNQILEKAKAEIDRKNNHLQSIKNDLNSFEF